MAQHRSAEHITSKWEWVAAAISGLIVAAMLAVLFTQAAAPARPPDVIVRVDSVIRGNGGYLASFTAENRGTETAAALQVAGELSDGDTMVESSSATIDYLPGESKRNGGLFFQRDPRTLTLRVHAIGYAAP